MRSFATIAAVVLYWVYACLILILEVSETCTMGGEGLLVHLIIGAPLAIASALLTYVVFKWREKTLTNRVSIGILPVVAVLLVFHSVQVWEVSILGHHSCGEEYDTYLDVVSAFERWVPLVLLSIDAVVGWLVGRSLFKPNRT